ncbi:hypothetical protein DM860_015732 [Cuscuta australis]|uniref:Bifunctional inhibitor/plant lipid transfer protein/seed storage helical domain-containing protein n=1 Tax=Cuscuta australis TaxID=267555 RepID=A0A328DQK6_9ASTE|nr:hypothetical protein DM860_015732 [Cuscuta australis]
MKAFILVFLCVFPMAAESHWKVIGPLCASQITLVDHACSFLPFALPPPTPPSLIAAPGPARPDNGHHSRRHGPHRRHRRHRRESTPEEEICCRWLREVDDECVCQLLAQLPAFLSKPVHQYSVIVGEACNENFQCGSGIKPHG